MRPVCPAIHWVCSMHHLVPLSVMVLCALIINQGAHMGCACALATSQGLQGLQVVGWGQHGSGGLGCVLKAMQGMQRACGVPCVCVWYVLS